MDTHTDMRDGASMSAPQLPASILILLLAACATPQDHAGRSAGGAGLASATPAASAGDIDAGHAIARANCATCHAIARTGESPNPMSPPFRTLSARYPVESLAESFAEGVFIGHPVMPEFRLEPAAVDQLIAYLASIQDPP